MFAGTLHWQVRHSVQITASRVSSKQQEDIIRHVDSVKRELMKQNEHCQASIIHKSDVNHQGKDGSACDNLQPGQLNLDPSKLNSSSHIPSAHRAAAGAGNSTAQLISPVVVLAHDRVGYLAKTLTTLIQHWSSDPTNEVKFPLFVSVDSDHLPMLMLATALKSVAPLQVIHNLRSPDSCGTLTEGYCWLSHHYRMLLQLFFVCLKAPRLIFIEEDLEVAPDFFSYFTVTAPLMDCDPSILCVSAWSDHGQRGRVANASALYRTDVMPGLGWMLPASVGLQALPGWPGAGRDEYLRDQRFIKGRQCVFPEVPRTHTFGAKGASGGVGFKEHLAVMELNSEPVDWPRMDLSYLLQDKYAALMRQWLAAAVRLQGEDLKRLDEYCRASQPLDADTRDLLVGYKDNAEFSQLALKLGPMMWDISYGGKVPRGSYNGTVTVRCRGRRLFLVRQSRDSKPGWPGWTTA